LAENIPKAQNPKKLSVINLNISLFMDHILKPKVLVGKRPNAQNSKEFLEINLGFSLLFDHRWKPEALVENRPKAQNPKKLYFNMIITDHTKNLVLVGKRPKPKKLSVINLSFSLFTDHTKNLSLGSEEIRGTKP
jgi:hypothetical protein